MRGRVILALSLALGGSGYGDGHASQAPAYSRHVFRVTAAGCKAAPARRTSTGFLVAGKAGVVTALHGVAGCREINARGAGGVLSELKVSEVDVERDTALLTSPVGSPTAGQGFAPFLGDLSAEPSPEILIVGFPEGVREEVDRYEVRIRDRPLSLLEDVADPRTHTKLAIRESPGLSTRVLNVEGSATHGDSGAPVLTRDGRIVGMIVGGLHGVTAVVAIPWSDLSWQDARHREAELERLGRLAAGDLFAFPRDVELPGGDVNLRVLVTHGEFSALDEALSLSQAGEYWIPVQASRRIDDGDRVLLLLPDGRVIASGRVGGPLASDEEGLRFSATKAGASLVLTVDAKGRQLVWSYAGGWSQFTFDPKLPRTLTAHETHPGDRAFLSGSAGTTNLDSATLRFLDLSIQVARTSRRRPDLRLQAAVVVKLPVDEVGRERKQQENDPRPPHEGSFIYTQIESGEPAVELGLGFARGSGRQARFLLESMVYVGYWRVSYSQGWDRFGSDETALTAEGSGLSVSPQFRLSAGSRTTQVSLNLGFRTLDLDYGDAGSGGRSQGWEAGLEVRRAF